MLTLVLLPAQVLLQGFNWECCDYEPSWYQALAGKAYHIKASGFNAVWLPPPSVSVSKQVLQ